MNLENIVALLYILLDTGDYISKKDRFDKRYTNEEIIQIIYFLLNYMEKRYYGYQEDRLPQIFNDVYMPILQECFFDYIAEFDVFDEIINESLNYRNKKIECVVE